jgi:SAM-dependent methyltransferase
MAATTISASSHRLSAALGCPLCRASIPPNDSGLSCENCGANYPVLNGILDLRPAAASQKPEELAWTEHWSDSNQHSTSQRFFSFYRKAVFAGAVAYFVDRYLAGEGLLVEAGSGTSETSMNISKRNGARTLVALDLIRPVLERCHPVIDVRICGDIFALPFQNNSLDGIWNVGVMEHFTHEQIDAILREFRRTLKPGGRIVLLWPAKFSIPQRILRILEWFINLRRGTDKFRFHPDEISQLRSVRQGKEVLTRNGFHPVAIDIGVRTLMAFETLVAEK